MLGDAIRRLRKEKNLTQEALAVSMGVERTTVTMWESGAITPPTKHLVPLAEALGCTLDELLRGDDT
jgi:transcriptional regulator with XRE-family HTH domain